MKEETKITLDYYNQKAKLFSQDTQKVDFSSFQTEFLGYLPENAKILDLGCGAGRDSKFFISKGNSVTAVDGSEELCKIASEYIGQPVICTTFQDYQPDHSFDGIWACASLLHLSQDEVYEILDKLSKKLTKDGCFYLSFKYGDFSGLRNGRYFQNMTEVSFKKLLEKLPCFDVISLKISSDVREGREDEKWLNVFLRKKN